MGQETVDEYYRRRLIRKVADLYDITVQDINGDGSRERTARKIVEGIKAAVEVPFGRVVFALGIRLVGETSAKILARHFKNIDALMNATLDQLTQIDGIGEVMAKSVITYFHTPENQEIVERLRGYGLQMSLSEEQLASATDILAGKTIVVSGVVQKQNRDE